ncbi:hypothetical protein pdam_00016365 [Pocillopora damicornis]|uniref:EGF-like domain-containing protein n=1 Tax=Pocillopora damicornis TaxID=46731 RepID=A0A3M6V0G4_POCDA|nr:uncharacterized protein LOC113677744 [Pocillopora damicornis]RMX59367.1 hypothetical protein pdam_00016365 [Pocillopora damicornis]
MTFKLYCTIFASIFFFQFKEAIFTDYKSSVDVSNGILSFANLFSFPNYLLNATPFESLFVYGEQDCLQACTENPRCRSLNFKGSKVRGKFLCNLLDTDKFKSLKLFGATLDFHHFSVTAPCELNPCENGGTCHPVEIVYDFKCACPPGFFGKQCEKSAKSCAELLEAGFTDNGVYKVFFNNSQVFDVYCDQSSRGGGWTMVFKVVSGVSANGKSSSQLWSSPETINENRSEALNIDSSFREHYKNRFVPNWHLAKPKEVQIALYRRNGSETLYIVFDSTSSDNKNWFSKSRIVHSPWRDLESEHQNYFSIEGCCSGRDFYISRNHGSCHDAGWLAITVSACGWEKRLPPFTVLYSNRTTYTSWNQFGNVGVADLFVVYIR